MSNLNQRSISAGLILNVSAVSLLLATLLYGNTEMIQSQLLKWGESFFPGYHELRSEPTKATCDSAKYRSRIHVIQAGKRSSPGIKPAADDLDSLLDDQVNPEIKPASDDLDSLLDDKVTPDVKTDNDGLDALLEDTPAKTPPPKNDELDALLDEAPSRAGKGTDPAGDGLDALLDTPTKDPKVATNDRFSGELAALRKAIENCEATKTKHASIVARTTDGVRAYRGLEGTIGNSLKEGVKYIKHILVLLLMVCALCTTIFRHHIALRPAQSKLDIAISEGIQLLVNLSLMYSAWAYRVKQLEIPGGVADLPTLWMLGFGALAVVNCIHLVRARTRATEDGRLAAALLTIPLYTIMGLIAALYFFVFREQSYASGLIVSVDGLTENSYLYLQVGLYVWVGMLLKRTELASMCFDVVRPWKLPAELLAFVAVVGAALPTAYSGASGIFVIAVGAIIYQELRKAGARNQLALAATAMSGSMGVVLRPCLLVVVVAAVNKEVTTGPLYSWGFKVFMLTAVLFLIASLINREGPMTCARPADAIPGMFGALRKLSGYVIVFFALLLGYRFVLNKSLDETSAPMILPILMMGLLLFDQLRKRVIETKSGNVRFKFVKAVSAATAETTSHIGALLMLMALSLCVGAVIERAELMAHVPQTFGSIWSTMGVLVFVLVIIGMTMDPYGAVILVSVTLANIANNAGIHPVHFWMVVLVAFELGYLTPPVALNHLLTRQVVGSAAFDEPVPLGANFWARNERILLPVSVMATALLIVAFIPLTGFGKTLWAWFN